MGTGEPALARIPSVQGPASYGLNMYTSIQSQHFSTSLDAGVQLFYAGPSQPLIGDVLK